MRAIIHTRRRSSRAPAFKVAGLTLVEVLVALGISLLAVSSIVTGYLVSISTAQRSSLYLAAGAKALERVEQIRSAKWDTSSWPPIDQLVSSNFSNQVIILGLASPGGNMVFGTNYLEISQISLNPPLKRIHVDCVWSFRGLQLLTNTLETCRAPDQ